VLCTRPHVKGDFAIINADDFYGKETYKDISGFFIDRKKDEYLLVGYKVNNTLSENGSTKRGVCQVKDGYLEKLIESVVEKQGGIITAKPLSGIPEFRIEEDNLVAMNVFGFTDDFYEYLEEGFKNFLNRNKNNLEKCEYLIADIVYEYIQKNAIKVKVVPTVAEWEGITYKEDKEKLINAINLLIDNGTYPSNLWE